MQSDITILLNEWRDGDEQAGRQLMAAVYGQLRGLAGACLRDEKGAATLQPTALVNELYVQWFSGQPVDCDSSLHFLNLAARQMRHIIIDRARRRKTLKNGGPAIKLTLDESLEHGVLPQDEQMTDLNEALERLEKLDERAARIVELRFFGGLTEQETAAVLKISAASVRRDWEFARSWLLAQLAV